MKPITFCIPTAKNEKNYINLLIKSLKENTQFYNHEILIFIDSDNQDTFKMLVDLKKELTNIKIYKNNNKYPVGGQSNISIMFQAASNDIVCYLQSDMVVGKDLDKHILNSIDENTILSCTRIEPSLHPPSYEKVTMDFGVTPEEFRYNDFNIFVEKLQQENKPNINEYFAPFAVYKQTWFNKLGGFDTQFRCSREDSDILLRIKLCELNIVQSWKACVYHFTCVSSRGKDWFKNNNLEVSYKNELQLFADREEIKRFIRKWGTFTHHPKPVYDIAFHIDIDQFVDFNLLKWIEPYCKKLILSDKDVANQLISQIEFESYYYSNLKWGYDLSYWNQVKHLFNPINFCEKISTDSHIDNDVIISFKYSD